VHPQTQQEVNFLRKFFFAVQGELEGGSGWFSSFSLKVTTKIGRLCMCSVISVQLITVAS